ncbi:MAG: NAD(P)H-hydrate dehydratase [Candidatus Cloacimonadaceae bacterium]|nr:NAD(P)H-hydrate dehydratase [Candidatus Cloacimonadota bacterium]MDY0325343.1 NAD(P)H-hydrate dehydratase [Candidatus Cloacimonadaceae bacterium]
MRYVLSPSQMREMDLRTIEDFGISSPILMEVAGARCADFIKQNCAEALADGAILLCGQGNNGGDGYVIARHLYESCPELLILDIGSGKMSPETAHNRQLCERLGISIQAISDVEELSTLLAFMPQPAGILVDALFGIGFHGTLPSMIQEIFGRFEEYPAVKIAIDIPSGLDAHTGTGYSLKMDYTLAIEELKYGHLLENGRSYCGEVITIPIGIPESYKDDVNCYQMTQYTLPERYEDAHKGSYGRVIVIGGSVGFLGSVKLASTAALKSGAGLIYLYTRQEIYPYYTNMTDEIMVFPIPEADAGNTPDSAQIVKFIQKTDAITIGCGMGLDAYALALLKVILQSSSVPTVVDADALNLISEHPELEEYLSKGNFLLTPHKGEFCRLAGLDMKELEQDTLKALKDYQAKVKCPILLKSHTSIYMDSHKTIFLTSGNDALATGGSGDMLSGIISSFAAQGLELSAAATSASLLMGQTAERLSQTQQSYSLTPSDIIAHLGDKDA